MATNKKNAAAAAVKETEIDKTAEIGETVKETETDKTAEIGETVKETETDKTAESVEQAAAPAAQEGPARYRVTYRFGLNLREEPGQQGKIIKALPCGTMVTAAGEPKQIGDVYWLPVDGGWVDMHFLALQPTE